MGTWGYGISQNDTFCEIQEEFRKKWNLGQIPDSIALKLYEQLHDNLEFHIGILAIADSMWRCNALSTHLLDTVTKIVEDQVDIQYWKSLGVTDEFIYNRKIELDTFLERISQKPTKKQQWKLTPIRDQTYSRGMVFWYKNKGRIFAGIVLDEYNSQYVLIAITEQLYEIPKNTESVLFEPLYTIAWFDFDSLLSARLVHKIGYVKITGSYIHRAGLKITENGGLILRNVGQRWTWAHSFRAYSIPESYVKDILTSVAVP